MRTLANWQAIESNIRKECKAHRRNPDYIQKFISYAKKLYDKNVPIISSPLHFSMLVGMEHQYVCNMANASSHFYRQFTIIKANGKERIISEPLPDLKFVQHWILENILEKCPVSKYAKAYVKKRTLRHNARFHKAQPVLLTMDIKDFFPSITEFDVFTIFKEIGYLDDVCWFLANLCCLKKSLPQGAPTSPYLSNLRMEKIDSEISDYIVPRHIRYTRYADDLTFSGKIDIHETIRDVSAILYKNGFKINPSKTRVARQNARQEVTGIVVNSHMQIPKEKRKSIRQQVYYIKKYGIESHLDYIGETRANYLNHLLGQINFALFVNAKDNEMAEYFDIIKSVLIDMRAD